MPLPLLWPETVRIDPLAHPARDAVAVYLLELDIPAPLALLPRYLSYLGGAENERKRAMRPAHSQWQYLQSRVLRRVVLSAYAGHAPDQLRFARDRWGRACLLGQDLLHFSLSHCASHVALAVGSNAMLGIGVATTFPKRPHFMRIARRYFNAADLAQLEACPSGRRYYRFLELWTLKQAYLKALPPRAVRPLASCTFSWSGSGLLVCDDHQALSEPERPDAFISQQWGNTCQLGLALRSGQPVSYHYLNGGSLGQVWPHTRTGDDPVWTSGCGSQLLPS